MRHRKGTFFTGLLLFIALLFPLAGCGGGTHSGAAQPTGPGGSQTAPVQPISAEALGLAYHAEILPLPEVYDSYQDLCWYAGQLYAIALNYGYAGGGTAQLVTLSTETGAATPVGESIAGNGLHLFPAADSLWLWVGTREGNTLRKIDAEGNLLEELELPWLTLDAAMAASFAVAENGDLYIDSGEAVLVFSSEGESLLSVSHGSALDGYGFAFTGNRAYIPQELFQGYGLDIIDAATRTAQSPVSLETWCTNVADGALAGYTLCYNTAEGLYGWSAADGTATRILDWADVYVPAGRLEQIVALPEGEFLVSYRDGTGKIELVHLTLGAPETGKTILTMAGIQVNPFAEAIAEFNRNSEDYEIVYTAYGPLLQSGTFLDIQDLANLEILLGDTPDIIVLEDLPVDRYIELGILTDLYPYLDGDEELSREDFNRNVLSVFETDGALYELPIYFSLHALLGRTGQVGSDSTWSMEEFLALWDAAPAGTQVIAPLSQTAFITEMVNGSPETFVDWETGTVHFDSPLFVELLEIAASFPDTEAQTGGLHTLAEGESLYSPELGAFYHLQVFRALFGGSETTLIGYPTDSKRSGIGIVPAFSLGISSQSTHKEAAWSFIRTLLTPEYVTSSRYPMNSFFPLNNEGLQEKIDWELDQTAKVLEYTIDGEVVLFPMAPPQEDVDTILEAINAAGCAYRPDYTIQGILEEELAPFFAGDTTAQQTAAAIQSRVQLYVAEQR